MHQYTLIYALNNLPMILEAYFGLSSGQYDRCYRRDLFQDLTNAFLWCLLQEGTFFVDINACYFWLYKIMLLWECLFGIEFINGEKERIIY